MGRGQKGKESKRTGKATPAHLAKENAAAPQRSVCLNVRDGCGVLSPISFSTFNTPSEYGRTSILPKKELASTTPVQESPPDFAAGEGKQNFDRPKTLAGSLSSCTADSSSAADGQVDHARTWSNAIFLSKNSDEVSTCNDPTTFQVESSPSTTSQFEAATNTGSNNSIKLEQLRPEEKTLQGEIRRIKDNDQQTSEEKDLLECRKVDRSFISDAGGIAGSSSRSSVSYGSQGSEWFTPLNTRRELGSLPADSRQCSLKEQQMVDVLSTKKTLFDMLQESDGCEDPMAVINAKRMEELGGADHCLSGAFSDKVKGKERVGNQQAQGFPPDAEHVTSQEMDPEEKHRNQAKETVLNFEAEGCDDLCSPVTDSRKGLSVLEVEAELDNEICRCLEEEITIKISHLSKKLEDVQRRQKSRCSSQSHVTNDFSSKISPLTVNPLPSDNTLKPVAKSMGKRRKCRVISAKFLDWQNRSLAYLGSNLAKNNEDDGKPLTARKIENPPPSMPYGGAREVVPAVKMRSVEIEDAASNKRNPTKNMLSEKRVIRLGRDYAVKEKGLKSNWQQGVSKFKLGTCAGVSEKPHKREDDLSFASMSPAFIYNDYSERLDWVKTLRSGGAHGVPSKTKIGAISTKCAGSSIGHTKYSLQSVYTEEVWRAPQVKKVSKIGSKGKEIASRVSYRSTPTKLQVLGKVEKKKQGGSTHKNMPKPKQQVGVPSTAVSHSKSGTILKACTQKSSTKPLKSFNFKPMKDSGQEQVHHGTSSPAARKENNSTPTTTKTRTKSTPPNDKEEHVADILNLEMENRIDTQVEDEAGTFH